MIQDKKSKELEELIFQKIKEIQKEYPSHFQIEIFVAPGATGFTLNIVGFKDEGKLNQNT